MTDIPASRATETAALSGSLAHDDLLEVRHMSLNSSHSRMGTKIIQATLIACLAIGLMAGSVKS